MKSIGLNELRSMFREFYVGKGHYARKSFSLVPESDKSLLIINSGMAPLKPYFAGLEEPPSKRMTTCQKCIRTGDLENVGHTARHGTFFEMLGSFSFGDYFKRESLLWGWEFITDVLELPVERLWASIYEEDDEAYDIWVDEVGIAPERVVRMGKDDNFWEIGLGPCGPCSEIYFDRGEKYGCGRADCRPGCDCDRYVEFWNHVFTQFDSDGKGGYTPLAHPNIDTGMGLERLACIMQDTDSIFDVDTIRAVLDEVCRVSGVVYENGAAGSDVSIRIVTDHIRSVVFMIGDGIIPGNEGRGYVLRRLLRRAAVHGKKLGITGLFLHDLADKVIETSGAEYEEIVEKQEYIKKLIRLEEERFAQTIDQGLELLNAHIRELKGLEKRVLSGDRVFFLYDTLGVNPELTREVLAEEGITIDEEGFAAELRKQQEKSRAGIKVSDEEAWKKNETVFVGLPATTFDGYDGLQEKISVNLIARDGTSVDAALEGDRVQVVFDRTPFYAESGGQVADIGELVGDEVFAEVSDVRKSGGVFVHDVHVHSGALRVGDKLTGIVNPLARGRTARNHTATHLLHKALVTVLGPHVKQAGSSVDPNALRFDFTHYEALSPEQIDEVQAVVNRAIDEFYPVTTTVTTVEGARQRGAMALFDEKYGDAVRLVEVGDFSAELCGGTHVRNSGEVGGFKIVSESSIGSGARRIEAITGTNLVGPLVRAEEILGELGEMFKAHPDVLKERVEGVLAELREARQQLESAKKERTGDLAGELLDAAETVENTVLGAVKLVCYETEDLDTDALRDLSDRLKQKQDKGLALALVSTAGEKLTVIVSATDDVVAKGLHAGKMVKDVAAAAGGGGGGKADMAQAGAKDPARAQDALAAAAAYIKGFTA
ncbi:MAG: alanine--tRNA ligase [Clostridiales Family XIII bacterium]|jgi:alanyl-tRNA synthetase|nr:alanine--tRNA ligase [Clostridiales Family XIII bacterium]